MKQVTFFQKIKNRADILFLQLSLVVISPFLATNAHASAFTKLTNLFTQWKKEFYGLLAVGAFIYVMWEIVKVWTNKSQWGDVGGKLIEVGAAGAIIVAVEFAWAMLK